MSLLDQLSSLCNSNYQLHNSNFFNLQQTHQNQCKTIDTDANYNHKYRSMTTTPIKTKNISNQNYKQEGNHDDNANSFRNRISQCATQRKPPMHSQVDRKFRNLTRISYIVTSKVRKTYYQFFIKFQNINKQKRNQEIQKQQSLSAQVIMCSTKNKNNKDQNGLQSQISKIKESKNEVQKYNENSLRKFVDTLTILRSKTVQREKNCIGCGVFFSKIKRFSISIMLVQKIVKFANVYRMRRSYNKISLRFKTFVKLDILFASLKGFSYSISDQLKRQTLNIFLSANAKMKINQHKKINLCSIKSSIPLNLLINQTKLIQIVNFQNLKSQNQFHQFFKENVPLKLNRLQPCDDVCIVNDVPDNGHLIINQVRLKNYFGIYQSQQCLYEQNDVSLQSLSVHQQNIQKSNLKVSKANSFHSIHQKIGFSLKLLKQKQGQQKISESLSSKPSARGTFHQLQTIRKSINIINNNNMIKDIRMKGASVSVKNKVRSSLVSTQRKQWDNYANNASENNQQDQAQVYLNCNLPDDVNDKNPFYKNKNNESDNIFIDLTNNKGSSTNNQTIKDSQQPQKNFIQLKQHQQQIKKSSQHKKILDKILTDLNAQYLQKSNKKGKKQVKINTIVTSSSTKQKGHAIMSGSSQKKSQTKSNLKICLKQSINNSSGKKKALTTSNKKNNNRFQNQIELELQSNSKSRSKQKDMYNQIGKKQNQVDSCTKKQLKEQKITSSIAKIEKFLVQEYKETGIIEFSKKDKNYYNRPQKHTRQSLKNKNKKAINVSLKHQGAKSLVVQQCGSTSFLPNFDDIQINFGQLQEINCSILKKPTQNQFQSEKPPSRQSIQYIQSLLQTMRSNRNNEINNQTDDLLSNYQSSKSRNSHSNITYFSTKPNNQDHTINKINIQKASMPNSKIQLNGCEMKKKKLQNYGSCSGSGSNKQKYMSVTPLASTNTGIRLSIKKNSFKKQKESWEDMFQKQKSKFLNMTKSTKQNPSRSRKSSHNQKNISNLSNDSSINKMKPRKSFICTSSSLTNPQSLMNSKVNLYIKNPILCSKNMNIYN